MRYSHNKMLFYDKKLLENMIENKLKNFCEICHDFRRHSLCLHIKYLIISSEKSN